MSLRSNLATPREVSLGSPPPSEDYRTPAGSTPGLKNFQRLPATPPGANEAWLLENRALTAAEVEELRSRPGRLRASIPTFDLSTTNQGVSSSDLVVAAPVPLGFELTEDSDSEGVAPASLFPVVFNEEEEAEYCFFGRDL